MRHLKDCRAPDGFSCRCDDIRERNSFQKRYGARKRKPKPIIKVPSLPVLARILALINRDYKLLFEKDNEVTRFVNQHAAYMGALGKDKPGGPYADWHNRASSMARGDTTPMLSSEELRVQRERRIAYYRGKEQALQDPPHSVNPYDHQPWNADGCAASWRDGWVDGMCERGLVTRELTPVTRKKYGS